LQALVDGDVIVADCCDQTTHVVDGVRLKLDIHSRKLNSAQLGELRLSIELSRVFCCAPEEEERDFAKTAAKVRCEGAHPLRAL